MIRSEISIDLGTSSVIVYIKGQGIVLQEPSIVAINDKKEVLAIGDEARHLIGRGTGAIEIRPLKDGIISDYNIVKSMIEYFLNKTATGGLFKPVVYISAPSVITEVEVQGLIDAAIDAGASKAEVVSESLAAACGAGVDIEGPYANMIVDIGGGTTDISVIESGRIIKSKSIKDGGDLMDESIALYIRKKYNSEISVKNAENIKRRIGSAFALPKDDYIEVNAVDIVTGENNKILLKNSEVADAVSESVMSITNAVKEVIGELTGEQKADITNNGIVLVGGGALLEGIDRVIEEETGIKTRIAENPITGAAIGTVTC